MKRSNASGSVSAGSPSDAPAGTTVKLGRQENFQTSERIGAVLKWTRHDLDTGKYRRLLYRFLADHVPVINSCVWTWTRLSAAPGQFRIASDVSEATARRGEARLNRLSEKLYANAFGNRIGLRSMLPDLFTSLFRDGLFGGFITVHPDGSGVDRFLPIDPIKMLVEHNDERSRLVLDLGDERKLDLDRPDFYYVPFNSSLSEAFGRSILQAIPFVAHIEQQLVEDMRRTSHNSGYHRLHVKVTPPDRIAGESESAYTERINSYFDSTVRMIKSCEVDDNPVTWDNVLIEHVGPAKSRDVTNSWFMNHRAMIEEICAGTHLAPYLLGYSFGATTTWAAFKFDVVMRQVQSVQQEVARFLEWVGNLDLAMAGIDARCRFEFDNSFAYQARDHLAVQTGQVDNVLKLFQAGLLDEDVAREKARDLL